MSKINYPLLRRVREMILKRPRQFEMGGFFENGLLPLGGSMRDAEVSHCGTACCVAGWAIAINEMPNRPKPSDVSCRYGQEFDAAASALGLTDEQANLLFFSGSWPQPHRDDYEFAKTYKARAEAGAARVSTFIRTRGKV